MYLELTDNYLQFCGMDTIARLQLHAYIHSLPMITQGHTCVPAGAVWGAPTHHREDRRQLARRPHRLRRRQHRPPLRGTQPTRQCGDADGDCGDLTGEYSSAGCVGEVAARGMRTDGGTGPLLGFQ